jgi:hypothetical protein
MSRRLLPVTSHPASRYLEPRVSWQYRRPVEWLRDETSTESTDR